MSKCNKIPSYFCICVLISSIFLWKFHEISKIVIFQFLTKKVVFSYKYILFLTFVVLKHLLVLLWTFIHGIVCNLKIKFTLRFIVIEMLFKILFGDF